MACRKLSAIRQLQSQSFAAKRGHMMSMTSLFALAVVVIASFIALVAIWRRSGLPRFETEESWLDRNW